MTQEEQAERDSNDLETIEAAKREFDGSLWKRIKRSFRYWKDNKCPIHNVERREHGFYGDVDCPECRREEYEESMKQ